jgi:hypothetical protein
MNLIGAWEVDKEDARTLSDLGDVLLECRLEGKLCYIIRGREKDRIILLNYKVEGSAILTDQPSNPRSEYTEFSLVDGILSLKFGGGAPYRFVRLGRDD